MGRKISKVDTTFYFPFIFMRVVIPVEGKDGNFAGVSLC